MYLRPGLFLNDQDTSSPILFSSQFLIHDIPPRLKPGRVAPHTSLESMPLHTPEVLFIHAFFFFLTPSRIKNFNTKVYRLSGHFFFKALCPLDTEGSTAGVKILILVLYRREKACVRSILHSLIMCTSADCSTGVCLVFVGMLALWWGGSQLSSPTSMTALQTCRTSLAVRRQSGGRALASSQSSA